MLREAVDMHEVEFLKVPEADNIADGFTKPITHTAWVHHMEYMAPHYDPTDSQPATSNKDGVLQKRTRVGNFLSCPSMEKIAWV